MYTTFSGLDFILSLVLFPAWLAAALAARRPASRACARTLRRSIRIATVVIAVAAALTAARLVTFTQLASLGWVFTDRKIWTALLLLLPGAIATLVWTLPALRTAIRQHSADRPAVVTTEQRAALAGPRCALGPQLAAFGSLGGFFEKFLPPHLSPWLNLAVYGGVLAVAGLLLAGRTRTRAARISGAAPAPVLSRGRRSAVRLGIPLVAVAVVAGLITTAARSSEFPATFSMMQGEADHGGGTATGSHEHHASGHDGSAAHAGPADAVSVADLRGPRKGAPDRRFTLTAQETKVKLASGRTVDAWAFNGQVPGPELRMKQGELVEIELVNRLDDAPVTVHWHGVDVPNGEDGVAGATQDAVRPGTSYTYRFRVGDTGSRWYHSHQQASEQVVRGLFGPLVIEPAGQRRTVDRDVTVVAHDWQTTQGSRPSFGTSDVLERRRIDAGDTVRLRLTNTGNDTKTFTLTGVPFRVTALDGTDVNEPGELRNRRLVMGGATRLDVEFSMPDGPVRLVDTRAPDAGIAFSPDGRGTVRPKLDGAEFDRTAYGKPARTPFGPDSAFDRSFDLVFDDWLGFYKGAFGLRQTVNGEVFPHTPMLMVKQGDLVRTRFVNRGEEDHPMHLHGHHMLVLSRNGKAVTGSPVWQDTVLVRPGEEWEVAFRADNPGIWMDHCHNFVHTSLGMVLHLSYEGVTTPYVIGGHAGNRPE